MSMMATQTTSLTIIYSALYLGAGQTKYQSFASVAFVRGIHQWSVISPHKWPAIRKMFPFDDVIMYRDAQADGRIMLRQWERLFWVKFYQRHDGLMPYEHKHDLKRIHSSNNSIVNFTVICWKKWFQLDGQLTCITTTSHMSRIDIMYPVSAHARATWTRAMGKASENRRAFDGNETEYTACVVVAGRRTRKEILRHQRSTQTVPIWRQIQKNDWTLLPTIGYMNDFVFQWQVSDAHTIQYKNPYGFQYNDDVLRLAYLYNGISFDDKTTSL